jgi:hypothetical protein
MIEQQRIVRAVSHGRRLAKPPSDAYPPRLRLDTTPNERLLMSEMDLSSDVIRAVSA